MTKTWFQGFIYKRFERKRALLIETKGQKEIKPKLWGLACKTRAPGWQDGFYKRIGVKTEENELFCKYF